MQIKCQNGPTFTVNVFETGVMLHDAFGQGVTIPWPEFQRLVALAASFQAAQGK